MNTATQPFETITRGDPEKPILFFVHGWPDSAHLWRKQFDALGEQFYCVAVTLPNFCEHPGQPGGMDFPELVEGLAATVRKHQNAGNPINLVSHDWGAYMGYMLERRYPELIEKMVALDVGGHAKPAGLKDALFTIVYQWLLLLFWLIGGVVSPIGNILSRGLGRMIGVPSRQRASMKSRFNYPYFYFWRSMLIPRWRSSFLAHYKPSCPVLYLYGLKKPVMFHSQRWLEIVMEQGGRHEGVSGAGHWFMESHPDIVNQAIAEWCSPTS